MPTQGKVAKEVAKIISSNDLPPTPLINVNIPNVSEEQIQGMKVTRLGRRRYSKNYEKREDPRGRTYYWLAGRLIEEESGTDYDINAVNDNYVSITPLHFDLTNYNMIETLKSWGFEKETISKSQMKLSVATFAKTPLYDKIIHELCHKGAFLMDNDNRDLIYRIESSFKRMSKGQKLIAEYILNNYDKAAFMTASRLGEVVGVSESTVVRFANALNYDGYPKLQKALQEMIRNKLTTVQRIEMTSELEQSMVLKSVLKADMQNIRQTIEEINNDSFNDVVDKFLQAQHIYILGLRSASPLAQFMGYYLNFMFDNVKIVTSGVNDILEQLFHIGKGDLLVCNQLPKIREPCC